MNRPWLKPTLVSLIWLSILGPVLGISFMLLLAANSNLPTTKDLEDPKNNLATEVFSNDGKILGTYFQENRTNVNFTELSPHVVNALVATEDERFYEHSGIDLRALMRVAKGVATANMSQGGGSTLTQQLAKMLFSEKPSGIWSRVFQKFQEWIIAARLEKQYTKSEIITMYLNKLDFIYNAVGIKSAAGIYFNKTPDSLRVEEAALLVGMAKNPNYYNPVRREERAVKRREVVLKQMVRNNFLSQVEYDSLRVLPLGLSFKRVSHLAGPAPYFREILRGRLKSLLSEKDSITGEYLIAKADGTPFNIYKDGLKVYTSIDSRLQEYAEEAVVTHLKKNLQPQFESELAKRRGKTKENIPFDDKISERERNIIVQIAINRSERYQDLIRDRRERFTDEEVERFKDDSLGIIFNKPVPMTVFSWEGEIDTILSPIDSILYYKRFLRAGMTAIDPKTGFVKAWVGGPNYKHFKFDHVSQGTNQVGSTFKPIIYATAIREGKDPCSKVPNSKYCFDMPGGQERWCPKNSNDKYEGILTLKQGLAGSVNTITAYLMKQFGPQAVIKLARDLGITSPMDAVPSLCLGVADVSLLEMVSANATFVNKGVHIKPIIITRIEDNNGNSIFDVLPKTHEALDERTAYIMLDMMKEVVNKGTGIRLRGGAEYAGFKNPIAGKTGTTQNNSDGWFMGLTPDLACGVWVGGEDRSVRFSNTYYGQGANMALPIWGYFMKKALGDPKIGLSTGDFEPPYEGIEKELDCNNKVGQNQYGVPNFGG